MTLENIDAIFASNFQHWDIRLPSDDVEARLRGKLHQAGWTIWYLFGTEGDSEYLDYYAAHRMTNDRHVRIYSSGKTESLETPRDFSAFPADADEATCQRITDENQAHNRAIYQRLQERGFMSEGPEADHSGGRTIRFGSRASRLSNWSGLISGTRRLASFKKRETPQWLRTLACFPRSLGRCGFTGAASSTWSASRRMRLTWG